MIYNNNPRMDADSIAGSSNVANNTLEKPKPVDVSDFKQAMSGGAEHEGKMSGSATPIASQAEDAGKSGEQAPEAQMQELLMMLLRLIEMLGGSEESGESQGSPPSGGDSLGSSGASSGKVENNKVVGENIAQGDGQIPKPTENMQNFSLGDKQVAIGGDGSASASEVQQTKQTLTDLYQNSPSFKEMIDSSPNESFEVSVGKRSDNMSWGNADGRVFMNVNDITPGSSDNFQALTAHEFAHAGIDLGHGSEMQRFEQVVSQEA